MAECVNFLELAEDVKCYDLVGSHFSLNIFNICKIENVRNRSQPLTYESVSNIFPNNVTFSFLLKIKKMWSRDALEKIAKIILL